MSQRQQRVLCAARARSGVQKQGYKMNVGYRAQKSSFTHKIKLSALQLLGLFFDVKSITDKYKKQTWKKQQRDKNSVIQGRKSL